MTNITYKEQWDRCVEFYKNNLTETQFGTWIKPMTFCSYTPDKGELKVGVPSHFFYEYLEEHYAKLIHAGIHREFGEKVRLFYKILTDKENRLTQVVEGSNTPQVRQPLPQRPVNIVPGELQGETPAPEMDSHLLKEYNFDNFIEGHSNKLPRSVGMSIAENPKQMTFNPLFIYGHSGVGKTHLVNAIGTKLKEKHPNKRVIYLSAHLFHVQFVDAKLKNKINDFIRFYQQIDVLILDDVQEFVGWEKTQNTFFHIFNHLKQNGKQIILTCDRPPLDLQGMEERLLTRFKWGLLCELEQPNEQLRHDILESKIHSNGLKIPKSVVDYISENVTESVRDLEGVVNSLMAHSVFYNRNIDLSLARQIVSKATRIDRKPITIDDIINQVCAACNVRKEEIFTSSRKASIVEVRQIAMYLAQKHTQLSTNKIGMLIGKRNHTTVLHSINTVKDLMESNQKYRQKVQDIEESVKMHKPIEK